MSRGGRSGSDEKRKLNREYRVPDLFKQFHCNEVSSVNSEPACGVLTEGDAYLINERRESHRVCRMV